MKKKLLAVLAAACMMTAAFTGCGSEPAEEELQGNLTLAGSTSMEKYCEALSESFMAANPGVTVTVEYLSLIHI